MSFQGFKVSVEVRQSNPMDIDSECTFFAQQNDKSRLAVAMDTKHGLSLPNPTLLTNCHTMPPLISHYNFSAMIDHSEKHSEKHSEHKKINVQTATKEELMKIPGMGVKYATQFLELLDTYTMFGQRLVPSLDILRRQHSNGKMHGIGGKLLASLADWTYGYC